MVRRVKFIIKWIRSLIDAMTLGVEIMQFRIAVGKTPSVQLDTSSSAVIYSLVSHHRVIPFLLSIKSFMYYSKERLQVVVLDDGSLKPRDLILMKKHLPGISIIQKKMADEAVRSMFKSSPWLLRQRGAMWSWRKAIDFYAYESSKKMILLDSDVIFYHCPKQLIRWVRNDENKNYFMDDFRNYYILSSDECLNRFNLSLRQRVNAGLICINPGLLSVELLSRYSRGINRIEKDRCINMYCVEQTYYALLFNLPQIKQHVVRLPTEYFLYAKHHLDHMPIPKQRVCIHYTGVFEKEMYRDGIQLLKKEKYFCSLQTSH